MHSHKSDLDSYINVDMNFYPFLNGEKDLGHVVFTTDGKNVATLTISSFLLKLEKIGHIQLIDEK